MQVKYAGLPGHASAVAGAAEPTPKVAKQAQPPILETAELVGLYRRVG
jgi:hypothetical protein